MPLARLALFSLAAALGVAACGGGGTPAPTTGATGTLNALLARPGPDVALVQGTSDYAVGPVRVTFLVIDSKSKAIERPRARVWVATSLGSRPLLTTEAKLEPIGVPGTSAAALGGVRKIYVARFRLAKPGTYTILAEPEGAEIQGVANLKVAKRPQAPAVGDRAIPSRTPTLASPDGDPALVTTANPPDRSLLRYSVADSLAAHAPFVLALRDAEVLPVAHLRADGRRRRGGAEAIRRHGDPLHPRRDLPGQQPGAWASTAG